ncbi:MAG: hypothetical protein FJY85_16940 [Deltaproteobacteria bacterium]|nr:hypothetical protein [Deltaproteobacteria bacterium]
MTDSKLVPNLIYLERLDYTAVIEAKLRLDNLLDLVHGGLRRIEDHNGPLVLNIRVHTDQSRRFGEHFNKKAGFATAKKAV